MKIKINEMFYDVLQRLGRKIKPPEFIRQHNEFIELFNKIKSNALLSIERAFFLFQFSKQVSTLQGEVAEIGVYRGGGARILAEVFKSKQIHLFDTFEGMPEVDKKEDNTEYQKKGLYNDTSLSLVKNFLSEFNNIKFYKGLFPETADSVKNKKFCFVHIDTDIYQSTKACLEFFYPKMVLGGVIICDDFKSPECKGVEKAVEDFLKNKKEFPINTTQFQCAIIKL